MKKKYKIILGAICGMAFSAISTIGLQNSKTVQAAEVAIDVTNFPDYIFRNYVIENFDLDSDGKLSDDEIKAATNIKVNNKNISSLDGLEHFTALTELDCSSNTLINLDISKNTFLKKLQCNYNKLTNLDTSNNILLTELICNSNELSSLDFKKNTALKSLYCSFNKLTNLDLNNNNALEYVDCSDNKLTNLDLSNNNVLEHVNCSYNELTNLDLSNDSALKYVQCDHNELTNLDLSNNNALKYVYCYNNNLENLDVNGDTSLIDLYCWNNQLTNLNISSNTMLETLSCGNNYLINLDVYNNTMLYHLAFDDNQLTDIDLSKNIVLDSLYCSNNQLSSLDLSKNIILNFLDCSNNKLTSIDLGGIKFLEELDCYCNELTDLDLKNISSVMTLNCFDNKLTNLDLSKTSLCSLNCSNNKLTSLDLSNSAHMEVLACHNNQLEELKLNFKTYYYLDLNAEDLHSEHAILSNLFNIMADNNYLKVMDITKPATYQYSSSDINNGIPVNMTIIYTDGNNTTEIEPTFSTHLFNNHDHTSPVTSSPIVIYGNGGTFKTGTSKTTNKQFTAYTDILASYKYTLNNNGIVKPVASKVIVGITKSNTKPVVTKNKIIDRDVAKIARAKIKNGQITVTATGKEKGLVYLWIIDTGDNDVSECYPVDVLLAPRKLEVQDTSGNKLKNPKIENGKNLDVCVTGFVSSTKTDDCTYTATVAPNSQSYISVVPNGNSGNKFTITATGLKNNKNTKAIIIFQCNENGKKLKFALTITQ